MTVGKSDRKDVLAPHASVWVEASAGTGKTKILTDRLLRLLLEDVPPHKILAITFTKAAAGEMLRRLHEKVASWVGLDDKDLDGELSHYVDDVVSYRARARSLFYTLTMAQEGGIRIQTIHSYCQSILGQFPLEARLVPGSRVVDEKEATHLLEGCFERLLTTKDQTLKTAFSSLYAEISLFELKELLLDAVLARKKFLPCLKEGYLEKISKSLGLPSAATHETILSDFKKAFEKNFSPDLLQGLFFESEKEKTVAVTLMAFLHEEVPQSLFEKSVSFFFTQKNEPRKTLLPKNANDTLRGIVAHLTALIQETHEHLNCLYVREMSHAFLYVYTFLLALYTQKKEDEGILDYEDLISKTEHLLHDTSLAPWVLFKLDGGVSHILIDEAQDTTPEQWHIILALTREFFSGEASRHHEARTIFVVGDKKQSIYSFQGANPQELSSAEALFSSSVKGAARTWKTFHLDLSYRSTEAILSFVDKVFKEETLKKHLFIEERDLLHGVHRREGLGVVELWPLMEGGEKISFAPWVFPDTTKQLSRTSSEALAWKIAETISRWLQNKRMIAAKGRPIEPGDILILVRKRDSLIEDILKALKFYRVPVSGLDRFELGDHLAVKDLLSCFSFLLLPDDDLNLAVLLKSPLVGLSEEELFELAVSRGEKTLWQALQSRQSQNSRYKEVVVFLRELLNALDYKGPYAILIEILEKKGKKKAFLERLGYEALEALEAFLEMALLFEKEEPISLQRFMTWFQKKSGEVKRALDISAKEVRIMTVHGAKGLQAPVVFLPDTGGTPDQSEHFLWDDDYFFWVPRVARFPQRLKRLKEAADEVRDAEYMRLLYVALTRAEDELYIAGYQNRKEVSSKSWYALLEKSIKTMGKPFEREGAHGGYRYGEMDDGLRASLSFVEGQEHAQNNHAWAQLAVPSERKKPSLTPSSFSQKKSPQKKPEKGGEGDALSRERGKALHKLLEHLILKGGDLPLQMLIDFIKNYYPSLSDEADSLGEIALEAYATLQKEGVLNGSFHVEVPFLIEEEEALIRGQIDCFVIHKEQKEISLIDFKTTVYVPKTKDEITQEVRGQLSLYKKALLGFYPLYTVRSFVYWTHIQRFEEVFLEKELF